MTKKEFDLNKNISKPKKNTDLKAEKNDIEKGKDDEKPTKDMISILDILKYSTVADYIFVFIGFLGSVATGSGWPVMTILFGNVVDVFVDFEVAYANATEANLPTDHLVQEFMSQIYLLSGLLLVVMAVFIAGNYANVHCFQMFSLRQMSEIKKRYFKSILRQEVAWYDQQSSGEFASRISSDFKKFESGINENLGLLIYNVTGCVVNLIVGLVYGWKLSLVIIAMAPIIGASSYIMTRFQSRYTQQELQSYSVASSVAEEAISAIRTVFAFGGQHKESSRYEKMLKPAMLSGCKRNIVTAIGNSVSWGTLYASFALGIWYGVLLIINEPETYSIGVVVIVFWAITGTGYQIGYAAPYLESFQTARTAASGIYNVVERKSAIDPFSSEGKKLKEGYPADIEFRDVHFSYPSRPDVPVLRGLNLSMKSGETVALVGASGCGKSTVIQLVQRFYSPDRGSVAVGGCDVGTVNVGWLRQQMGVVGQEPVLFSASLAENITLGSGQGGEVSRESVSRAAKEANAHQFIGQLSAGYGTYVGDRGAQLSGGQKQRIAIARALVGHPRILLLDEATSALDLTSEQTVQTALHRASQGRTTLIVAHRLSTIRHAHRIVVLDQGVVKEMGTHEQLMALQGAYYGLVRAQEVENTDTSNSHPKLEKSISTISTKPRPHGSTIGSTGSMSTVNQDGSINFMEDADEIDEEVLKKAQFPYFRVLKLILSDKLYFSIALVSALLYGLCTPIYALIFGSFVGEFSIGVEGHEEQLKAATIRYSIFFVALAVGMFLTNTLQISLFGIVGEKLTMRLRMLAFNAILNQECAWFDEPTNSAGALCSRLANDAANVQGATGLRVAMMCQAVSTLIACILVGFIVNWKIALCGLALMPIVAIAAMASAKLYSGQAKQDGLTAQQASKVVIEVMNAVRTVVSLHKQQYFFDKFVATLDEHYNITKKKIFCKAFVIGLSLGAPFFSYSIAFMFGGWLISIRALSSGDFFRVVESMVFGAMVVGNTAVLSSDFAKAKIAAINIFKLIDRKPVKLFSEGETLEGVVHKTPSDKAKGQLAFRGVSFNYPSRPENTILNGLSFSANPGETVALVGASGCGKSTTVQLLEQFYECSKGKILLDGTDISSLPVDWVRSQMSLVSQEPVLFSYSIAENIAYGDNSRVVGREEIVRAAEAANVHSFVDSLPLAYDTPVGGKGSQLSGGQKQRIAIARALLRDPAVLIMDEATSALDTASEKVVQQALEEAARGRTSLLIAHRLKTIQAAQRIVVLDQGRAVEEGTHQQLLQLRGHYYRLYNSALTDQ